MSLRSGFSILQENFEASIPFTMGPNFKPVLLITSSVLLLGASGVWLYLRLNPEWKRHQRAAIEDQIGKAEESYAFWSNPEYGTPEEAEKVKAKLDSLKKRKLEIKEIMLEDGVLRRDRENGQQLDRCMTCHIDEEKLVREHPEELPLPFNRYGCTICHNGNGEALETEQAHKGMYANRKAMIDARFESADALITLWERIRGLNPEKVLPFSRESLISPTGEYQIYVGSRRCLKCHTKTHPEHVKRWAKSKFQTFERVRNEPDFQKGNKKYRSMCYRCHTTGYREDKDLYAEEGVGCEACHGPGEVYSELMAGKKTIGEARKLMRVSFGFSTCGNCHIPKRHEMRREFFAKMESNGEE